MIRRLALAVVSTLVLAGAVPAASDVVLATQQVYFKCGASKAGNLDASEGRPVAWSTQAPTTSATQGGGCGILDVRGDQQLGPDEVAGVPVNADFAGTFTGNLDTLTVRAWNLDAAHHRAPALIDYGFSIRVTLTIDGVTVLDGREIVLEPDDSDAATLMEFSVVGLGLVEPEDAGQHTVALRLDTFHQSEASVWVYDATEVDSGIVFNPAAVSDAKIVLGTE